MSAPLVLQQYWQLVRTLMFPLQFTRWLMMSWLALSLVGCFLFLLAESFFVLMFCSAVSMVLFLFISVIVPAQMLSLVSSKQLSWIPDLRRKTFYVLFLLYGGVVLLVSVFVVLSSSSLSFTAFFGVAFAYCALIAAFILLTGVYFQKIQMFTFVFAWVGIFVGEPLLRINPLISIMFGALIWSGLYMWWRQWFPNKYFQNYMALSHMKMRELYEQQSPVTQVMPYKLSFAPRSLCGSLLINGSDNLAEIFKREVFQLCVLIVAVGVLYFFVRSQPDTVFFVLPALLIFTLLQFHYSVQNSYFRHASRIWMLYPGTRLELFCYLEKRYLVHTGFSTLLLGMAITIASLLLGEAVVKFDFLIFMLASAMLFGAQVFYVGWMVYRKTEASISILNWVASALSIIFLCVMVAISVPWDDEMKSYHLSYMSGLLLVVMLFVLFFVRSRALRDWNKINFYRVKN